MLYKKISLRSTHHITVVTEANDVEASWDKWITFTILLPWPCFYFLYAVASYLTWADHNTETRLLQVATSKSVHACMHWFLPARILTGMQPGKCDWASGNSIVTGTREIIPSAKASAENILTMALY